MIRTLVVLMVVLAGGVFALQGPFQGLLLYSWNAYFRPETWVWTDHIFKLKLSFVIGCFVLVTTLFSRHRLRVDFPVLLLFALLLHSLASTLVSEHRDHAMTYWTEHAKAILVTYLITVLVVDLGRYRQLVLVITLSLGFEGARQALASLIFSPGSPNYNAIPYLGDNNGVAVGMLMLVPMFWYLSVTTELGGRRFFYRVGLFGVLYRALSTYSRGAFLSTLALAGVSWFYSRRKFPVFLGIVFCAALVLPIMPSQFWDRMRTIQTYEQEEESSAVSRIYFWKLAIQMADDRPFLGVGTNSYIPSYDAYDTTGGAYGLSRAVHSSWFGILADLGYLGAFLYVWILAMAMGNCRRTMKVARQFGDESLRRPAVALQASLVVFLVGGTFLQLQYLEMLWHFIGLSIVLRRFSEEASATRNATGVSPEEPALAGVEAKS